MARVAASKRNAWLILASEGRNESRKLLIERRKRLSESLNSVNESSKRLGESSECLDESKQQLRRSDWDVSGRASATSSFDHCVRRGRWQVARTPYEGVRMAANAQHP